MRKLSPSRHRALQLVADGKVYRTIPEEFHKPSSELYAPRVLWRQKGSPKPLATSLGDFLLDNDYIALDSSGSAALTPLGVSTLEALDAA